MQEPIFTFWKLEKGRVFEFYADQNVSYQKDETIFVWCEKENYQSGDKKIYGQARVIEVPNKPTGIYKAMIIGAKLTPEKP